MKQIDGRHSIYNDAKPVVIMTVGDGLVLLIIVQNDDDARRYGSLATPRRYLISDVLRHHFSSICSNLLMTLPFARQVPGNTAHP